VEAVFAITGKKGDITLSVEAVGYAIMTKPSTTVQNANGSKCE
jgi:hypothetical protein